MKRQLFKNIGLLAVFLLPCAVPARAQNILYNPQKDSEFSIIRNYADGIDITYNVFDSITSFNYVDRNMLTELCAKIPNTIIVEDFAVFGDSVYFCGYDNTSAGKAIFGYFGINDVFFSNMPIQYTIVDITVAPSYSQVTRLKRIAVMRSVAGDVHMLMVGKGYWQTNSKQYFYPGVILDVLVNTPGYDQIHYHLDKSYTYMFDDVTITDNYAVVSAHGVTDYTPCKHYIFSYINPTISGESYFNPSVITPGTPIIANIPIREADPTVLLLPYDDEVLITKMTQDKFATLCHRYNAGGNNLLALSIYDDPLNPPTYRTTLPFLDVCLDIVYNKPQKAFYMLAGWDYNLYCTKAPYTTTEKIYAGNCRWMSIDNADNDAHEIISGYVQNISVGKEIWRYDEQTHYDDTCISYGIFQNSKIGRLDRLLYVRQEIDEYIPRFIGTSRPTLNSISIKIECQN